MPFGPAFFSLLNGITLEKKGSWRSQGRSEIADQHPHPNPHPFPPHTHLFHTHTLPSYTQPPCPVTQGTSLCTPTSCSTDICHSQSQKQHWENRWLLHVGVHVRWIPAPFLVISDQWILTSGYWPMDTDQWIQSPCLLGERSHSIRSHFYPWSKNIGFGAELVNPWYLASEVHLPASVSKDWC